MAALAAASALAAAAALIITLWLFGLACLLVIANFTSPR